MSEETLSALIPQTDREKIKNVLTTLESYRKVTITNDSEFQNANDAITGLKKTKKNLDNDRKEKLLPHKTRTDYINEEYQPVIKAVQNGINNIDVGMGNYQRELRKKAQAEQAKLDAEAAEKRRKADLAAKMEADKVKKYEDEGRQELADKAKARQEAQQEQAETTIAPQVEPQKLKGTYFVEVYTARVTDKQKAVEFLMSRPEYEDCIDINLKPIERAQKGAKGKIVFAGIEFQITESSRTRT